MKKDSVNRRQFLKAAAVSAASIGLNDPTGLLSKISAAEVQNRKMPRRVLGKTGVKVPILQLGTSQSLDRRYDKILHRCFREGVNGLDTALSYGWGSSHRAIANFISQIGDRRKLWITSKSNAWTVRGLINDVDECLEQLETDYLDLYLMHGINSTGNLDRDYLEAGEKLRKSGKIRFFGFSNHGSNIVPLMHRAAKTGGIDAILFRYNFRRYGESELNRAIDACKKAGIGLIAMKTMGGVSDSEETVVEFQSNNYTLAQAKLKAVWADERIDTVVSEMHNIREVRENVAAAKSEWMLSRKEQNQLIQLADRTAHLSCMGCSHICENVTSRPIPIADSLRFLMYYEAYGKRDTARQLFQELPLSARNFEPSELLKASQLCPQKIDIAFRMGKARELLA